MNNYLSGNKYSENTSAKSNVSAKKDKKINNDRSKSADIVKKKASMIARFAKRMIKDKRKQDMERRKSMNKPKDK